MEVSGLSRHLRFNCGHAIASTKVIGAERYGDKLAVLESVMIKLYRPELNDSDAITLSDCWAQLFNKLHSKIPHISKL